MGKRIKRTNEELCEEALKYDTKSEFQKGSNTSYQAAVKRGILDEICTHMKPMCIYRSDETLQIIASTFNTRGEFQHGNQPAYAVAFRRGILDIICAHMKPIFTYWDFDLANCEAQKYTSRLEFQNNSKNAYNAALRLGILDEICKHMKVNFIYWNDDMLKLEGLKYDTRKEFEIGCEYAYKASLNRNIIDDVCSHMHRGNGGFDPTKPGYQYYIRFNNLNYDSLYKVGVTNKTPKERITTMHVFNDWSYDILQELYFENGKDALDLENYNKKVFKEHQYKGEPIMQNGNTELFIIDVLGLDFSQL